MAYVKINGIYTITCIENGKVYVGRSSNIKARWKRHEYALRDGNHWNQELQNNYNEYGKEAFIYTLIHQCFGVVSADILDDLEKVYVGLYESYLTGYNETLGGTGNLGKKLTSSTRKKMSDARKGKKIENTTNFNKTKRKSFYIDGTLYLGLNDTAKSLGIDRTTLHKRLKSDQYPNYKYA